LNKYVNCEYNMLRVAHGGTRSWRLTRLDRQTDRQTRGVCKQLVRRQVRLPTHIQSSLWESREREREREQSVHTEVGREGVRAARSGWGGVYLPGRPAWYGRRGAVGISPGRCGAKSSSAAAPLPSNRFTVSATLLATSWYRPWVVDCDHLGPQHTG